MNAWHTATKDGMGGFYKARIEKIWGRAWKVTLKDGRHRVFEHYSNAQLWAINNMEVAK